MRKKISIILPNLRGGGAERVHINLARQFIKKGFYVEFVLFQKIGELIKLVPKEAFLVDMKAQKLRNGFIPLIKYINKNKPDAILASMWPVTIIAIWAAKYSKQSPTVVVNEQNQISSTTVYKNGKVGFNKLLIPMSMRYSYPHSDAVVGVSKGVVQDLKNLSGLPLTNSIAIYNPAAPRKNEIEHIKPNNQFWNSDHTNKIISIGSLKKQKDYPTLIHAFEIIHKKVKAELLILGEGAERKFLEKVITKKKLNYHIHIPGFVLNPLEYLKSANLFVLSSTFEGLPTVIIEALACGVPVVSTNCKSGPAEILENGKYGTLVPVGDPEALAHAIIDNLNREHDPEPLKKRVQDFSAEKIARLYLNLLFPNE